MPSKINVDFYRVEILGNTSSTFENIVKAVGNSANDATRAIEIRYSHTRLQEHGEYPNFCNGDMVRIRMDDIPNVASLDGDIDPIDLEDDEGLGEQTAFLYQIPTRVLMLQRNGFGVSAFAFRSYFEQKSGVKIRLDPVMQTDVIERMKTLQTIKSFQVSIAKTNKMYHLKTQDIGVSDTLNLGRHFDADSINLEVSVGNQKSLSIGNVISAVTTWFNHANSKRLGDIKSIKVSGDSGNGTPELLDLLQDWIKESIDINPVNIRRIEYKERAQALRDAWIARRDQLEEMFLP